MGAFILILINAWHFEPIPEATEFISLDVDSLGLASVAYRKDDTIYFSARTAMGDSFIWVNEVVDSGAIEFYYGSVELAVDKETNPHLIYFKHGSQNYDFLYYAINDSADWNRKMLDSADYYYKSGLDTDTLDYPHIVFWGDSSYHLYWNGIKWIKEHIGDYLLYGYTSLVIDKNNRPHFGLGPAIIDKRHGHVYYGVKDSSGWQIEYFGQFDVRWPVGIAVDSSCNPHLCFYEYDPYSWYMTKQSGSWIYDDISALGFLFHEIVVDNTVPHLLGNYSANVRHIWKPDSVWQYEDIHTGSPLDLAIDKDGFLHCVIEDSSDVIYGTTQPQPYVNEEFSKSLQHRYSSTIISGPLRLPKGKNCKVYDISGRAVAVNNLKPGIYFIEIDGKISQKVVKIK